MKTKGLFLILSGACLLAVVIFSESGSNIPAIDSSAHDQSRPNQISGVNPKTGQSTRAAQTAFATVAEPLAGTDSFELIEKKYARLNPDQARQEVRRIDQEAHKVALKNFNDFSVEERTIFLIRQREKAVLLNKIILAGLERVPK